jgi:hypothetical protein
MTPREIKAKVDNLSKEYNDGQLTREDYHELLKDIDTSKAVTTTAEEVEEMAMVNKLINNIILGTSLI